MPLKNLLKNLNFWLSAGTLYTWATTKIFWIWFICTLEGYVVLCTYLILKKVQIWNTLMYTLCKSWLLTIREDTLAWIINSNGPLRLFLPWFISNIMKCHHHHQSKFQKRLFCEICHKRPDKICMTKAVFIIDQMPLFWAPMTLWQSKGRTVGGFLCEKVWNFKFGMLPSCCILLTDFKTVFVFALGHFLPM